MKLPWVSRSYHELELLNARAETADRIVAEQSRVFDRLQETVQACEEERKEAQGLVRLMLNRFCSLKPIDSIGPSGRLQVNITFEPWLPEDAGARQAMLDKLATEIDLVVAKHRLRKRA